MEKKNVHTPISWDEYFMGVAVLSSKRSKDPCAQVGACIVNPDKKIVGIGYNGFPTGCSDLEFPWGKESPNELETKFPYVVHAEPNAILNSTSSLKGATIYVTRFPCHECAKLIIQSGIKEVVYSLDKHPEEPSFVAARKMFGAVGVKCRRMSTVEISTIIK